MLTDSNILTVSNLKTYFFTQRGIVKAVNGTNFELKRGECLCLVGESGCGKSVTALSILRLFESPPGMIVEGDITYENQDLVNMPIKDLRSIRGKEIAMVFQDAQSALNPVFTIGDQIVEQIRIHDDIGRIKARDKAIDLLKQMGIPDADRAYSSYPHQLSGGMRQRSMIAMSLSCEPIILIADEPTTAVDVTIKAQILDLFIELKAKRNMSIIFITHDLGVVSEIGDRAVVMYGGEDVETAPVREIIENPLHPYTRSLLSCLPDISETSQRLCSIPGSTPNPVELPSGCTFYPRCPEIRGICSERKPVKIQINQNHWVSCHLTMRSNS